MDFKVLIHVFIISIAMLLGVLLRSKVKAFQKFLVPSSILGGFLLLIFYNIFAPKLQLDTAFLGGLVYHLLNISFIAMMLRPNKSGKASFSKSARKTTVAIIGQWGLQITLGLLLVLLLRATIYPNLFPSISYSLALGFELGPGQAYSMSKIWEPMGFTGASSIGLTMAAIGFIIGSIGGVILINIAIKRHWMTDEQIANLRSNDTQTGFLSHSNKPGSTLTTNSESIDTLTYHFALIFATYFLSWGVLKLLSLALGLLGPIGIEFANSLWGINFVFSCLIAIVVRIFLERHNLASSLDVGTLNRITGISVDTTVCASLGAISLVAIKNYWGPVLMLVGLGMIITIIILPLYTSRLFDDHQFYRTLIIFGASTGTLPTGLALLRVVDPNFETPVAEDYAKASGLVLPLAIPLILTINLPAKTFTSGNPRYFTIAVLVAVCYLIGFLIFYTIMSNKRGWKDKTKFFYVNKNIRNSVKKDN